MRKLALLPFVVLAVVLGVAASAQVHKPDGLHLGSKNTDVFVDGNLYVKSPDGGSISTAPGTITCPVAGLCGTKALTSGTPSSTTVTVPSGVTCGCWPIGTSAAIAAGGCAANVSSTTLTMTGPNTVTTTMKYICTL